MKAPLIALVIALAAAPACAQENDGLVLPPGFHAGVVAEGLGPLRHLAVRPNGDIYISTGGERAKGTGLIALRLGPDHKPVQTEHFSAVNGGTGIRFHRGMLYAASDSAVYRFRFSGDALLPAGDPEVVVSDIPANGGHALAFDAAGNLFVSVNGMSNACADTHAAPGSAPVGVKPCPDLKDHAGIWKFRADRTNQKFSDGEQVATGIRDITSLDWSAPAGLYGIMHARDGSNHFWPAIISAGDDDNIGDEMHSIARGADLGWPYSYYDCARNQRLLAPEYGGDGKTQAPAGAYSEPVACFYPMRAAPVDLLFYTGRQFPAAWRGGAFVALHGTGGPALPGGRNGYTVTFVPFEKSKARAVTAFADGFAGPSPVDKNSGKARYRPVGLAQAPDGSLYVADSNTGRIWRIAYGSQ